MVIDRYSENGSKGLNAEKNEKIINIKIQKLLSMFQNINLTATHFCWKIMKQNVEECRLTSLFSRCRTNMFLMKSLDFKSKKKFSDFEKISEWWRKLKLSNNAYTSEHSELSAMTENSFGMFLSCLTADVTTTYYSNSTTYYWILLARASAQWFQKAKISRK